MRKEKFEEIVQATEYMTDEQRVQLLEHLSRQNVAQQAEYKKMLEHYSGLLEVFKQPVLAELKGASPLLESFKGRFKQPKSKGINVSTLYRSLFADKEFTDVGRRLSDIEAHIGKESIEISGKWYTVQELMVLFRENGLVESRNGRWYFIN